jgi:hypothetical protein
MQALAAARETLYPQGRRADADATRVPAGTSGPTDAAETRTGLLVAHDTPSWGQQQADALTLIAETALHQALDPGPPAARYQVVVHVDAGGARRCRRGWSVDCRRHPGFRRDIPAARVRRQPRGHAPRRRWQHHGSRRTNANDTAGLTTGAAPPRPGLSVPRLRIALRPGPSHPPLGAWWADHTLQSHNTVSAHHRAIHEEGYQVERRSDGELVFRWPNGWLLAAAVVSPFLWKIESAPSGRRDHSMM